jgi:hypothetical protein
MDALDLMREWDRMALVIVDAGDPQQNDGYVSMLLADEFLSVDF